MRADCSMRSWFRAEVRAGGRWCFRVTTVRLQFHAAREEVSVLLYDWAHDLESSLLVESFWPEYSASVEPLSVLRHRGQSLSTTSRFCLSLYAVDDSGTSGIDTISKNPDVLTLLLGARTPGGVRACMLGALTQDPASVAAWKMVRARARKAMKKGACVVRPSSGARSEVPGHLYTAEAVQLSEQGVKLLAGAGDNHYRPFLR